MMFDSIEFIDSGSPKRVSFMISVVVHASVVTIAIITPLLFLRPSPPSLTPAPPTPVMLMPQLPVPSSGGSPRSLPASNPAVVRLPPNVIPRSIARGIPDPIPEGILEIRQLIGNSHQGPGGVSFGSGAGLGVVGEALLPVRVMPPPIKKDAQLSLDRRVPLRVSEGVIGSRLIRRVDPVYPPLAIKARLQGLVVLQVLIDEQGIVEDVSVISGTQLLAPAAIQAVKQWRYSPTLLNGQPVPVKATVSVNFVLR